MMQNNHPVNVNNGAATIPYSGSATATATSVTTTIIFPTVPRLYPNLKLALSILYTLQPPQQHSQQHIQQQQQRSNEAHEFLMDLQSRNVRRKFMSLQQKFRDQQQKQKQNHHHVQQQHQQQQPPSNDQNDYMGSSWLACLALLCCPIVQNDNNLMSQGNNGDTMINPDIKSTTMTERLFAAQTLLQRLRRVKMTEGIDWEMDLVTSFPSSTQDDANMMMMTMATNMTTTVGMINAYKIWMQSWNPWIASVLESYQHNETTRLENDDEERIKGELTLLTLAAVSFYYMNHNDQISDHNNVNNHNAQQDNNVIGPLIATCLSAFVTAAVRIRYRNVDNSITTNIPSQPSSLCVPLIQTVQNVFMVVWSTSIKMSTSNPASNRHLLSFLAVMYQCLGCIPDAVMGQPGGARGRLSIDPRCLQSAINDLRTVDISLLHDMLLYYYHFSSNINDGNRTQEQQLQHNKEFVDVLDHMILQTCTKWATFLSLTIPLLELAMNRVHRYLLPSSSPNERKMAIAFMIALYDSASWSLDQILSATVGFTGTNQQQQNHNESSGNKGKQSAKYKKKQKEIVEQSINDIHKQQAHEELKHRGMMACQATMMIWDTIQSVVGYSIHEHNHNIEMQVDGEGPIGFFASCSNACLPYIVRYLNVIPTTYYELFSKVAQLFYQLCSSPNKTIRMLSYEPLYSLHQVVVEVYTTQNQSIQSNDSSKQLEPIIVDFFFNCSMALALSCGYPDGYFDHLDANSDEDLEIERNDIRDVLRTITTSNSGGDAESSNQRHEDGPLPICMQILTRILSACQDVIASSLQRQEQQQQDLQNQLLLPETIVHAFSALAKPLNQVGRIFLETHMNPSEWHHQCLSKGVSILSDLANIMIKAFHRQGVSAKEILPLSRLVEITIASLSPMLASLSSYAKLVSDGELMEQLSQLLSVSIHCTILSLEHLPELFAPSVLEYSLFEIRGALRGPGGEDHVGCLALLRLATEGDCMTEYVVSAMIPYVPRLCALLQEFQRLENERGRGCHHGEHGVTSQSRRILVNVLCQLELKSVGKLGAHLLLQNHFDSTMNTILKSKEHELNENTLYHIVQSTFDLASFTPEIIQSLFIFNESSQQREICLGTITTVCVHGYNHFHTMNDEALIQWNRLRAALSLLLKRSINPDFPQPACEILIACILAECGTIERQCAQGPASTCSIFREDVISRDGIPAGLFVEVVLNTISLSNSTRKQPTILSNCIHILHTCKPNVLRSISNDCPDPTDKSFCDPRPTLAEIWFLVMSSLIESDMMNSMVETMLIETCVVLITMLFKPATAAKTVEERRRDHGMSLDGSQSRAGLIFLEKFMTLGYDRLLAVGQRLTEFVSIDVQALQQWCNVTDLYGISIIGASLFRANQGALPPWAAEFIPEIYRAFFYALRRDTTVYGVVMRLSMEVKLSQTSSFANVLPGNLLSGKFFAGFSEKAKVTLIDDIVKISQKDDSSSWRRMKSLIKQACGGKKKETDFGQKPPLTKWEFLRV